MPEYSIKSITPRACYNSRGEKTVEVDVIVNNHLGRASAPAGASVGKHEAISFAPEGVEASINLMQEYSDKLIGLDATNVMGLTTVLRKIDGSNNYSRIGGSIAYSITIATTEAISRALGLPLFIFLKSKGPYKFPFPLGNVLGGGKNAGLGAPDIQE